MNELSTESLAKEINTEHRLAYGAMESALAHAMKCGDLLTQAKALLKHGDWLPWLAENCEVGARQAENYMRLSTHRAELEIRNGCEFSLRQAVALLAEPSKNEFELSEVECIIGDGLDKYLEVGKAMKEIRDGRLYRENGTFEEYCNKRWGMESREANRLIQFSEIAENISTPAMA